MSKTKKDDIYWIELMIEFTSRALEYYEEIRHASYPRLVMEGLDDALASQIAHIGEQLDSNKLSKDVQERYPEIPWHEMKKYRNLHNRWYQDIRMSQVYQIAESDLEELLQALYQIRDDLIRERDDNQ